MFYTFHQSNERGDIVRDEQNGIAKYIIVEASSDIDALKKLRKIGFSFHRLESYCDCCGHRWQDKADDVGEEPLIYNEPVQDFLENEEYGSETDIAIHYENGDIKMLRHKDFSGR